MNNNQTTIIIITVTTIAMLRIKWIGWNQITQSKLI